MFAAAITSVEVPLYYVLKINRTVVDGLLLANEKIAV